MGQSSLPDTWNHMRSETKLPDSNPPRLLIIYESLTPHPNYLILSEKQYYLLQSPWFLNTKYRQCNKKLWAVWWSKKIRPIIKTKNKSTEDCQLSNDKDVGIASKDIKITITNKNL